MSATQRSITEKEAALKFYFFLIAWVQGIPSPYHLQSFLPPFILLSGRRGQKIHSKL